MNIALNTTTPVGTRTGRILLGERNLHRLGIVDGPETRSADPRVVNASDLADYDVLVSDDIVDPIRWARIAAEEEMSCVLWAEADDLTDASLTAEQLLAELDESFRSNLATLLTGANLGSGIAPSLASHEIARAGEVMEVTVAWTEPGAPLRRGEAVPFPEPVGARWGRERTRRSRQRHVVAPVTGDWAAALARVTGATSHGVVTRVVGVADLAEHLEALALAAAAITVAGGAYPLGTAAPSAAAEHYLATALHAGLDIASYTTEGA